MSMKRSKRKLSNGDEEKDGDVNDEKWKNLSREEIIQRCEQLEKHVQQLRNIISKSNEKESKTTKPMRPFDFSKHGKRHIFLKFLYLGWEYHVRYNRD